MSEKIPLISIEEIKNYAFLVGIDEDTAKKNLEEACRKILSPPSESARFALANLSIKITHQTND